MVWKLWNLAGATAAIITGILFSIDAIHGRAPSTAIVAAVAGHFLAVGVALTFRAFRRI